ncbi:mevalonate kinase [Weissella confusa]|uniref:mevalonate kinase n=1 Tax=Weissella confusa TaxID=1583 RepID=UPI0021AFFFCB|nr:mevalonate kinase [Weissella confusa]MCT0949402.1 mevalonate kinase [Weissella confusa]
MEKLATGTSHAKVILLGEHAVVYGQPAIALPLPDLAMTATIEAREEGQIVIAQGYQGPLATMAEVYEGVRQLIVRLLRHFNAIKTPFTLRIQSSIPQERGMGSSAASAIAIVRAFFAFFETELSDAELQRWANIEEAITHGSPSGIDAATTAHDVPVWFVKGEKPEPMSMALHGTLIIADTGVHGQTGLAVSVVREQLDNEPEATRPHIDALGQIARETREDLANDDIQSLGRHMNDAQSHLSALGVSHPKLDELINAANQAGALGAKLTGGGVGGAMLALAQSDEDVQHIIQALEAAGAQEVWAQRYPQM